MTKRVIRRFTKDEDELILQHVGLCNGDVNKAIDDLVSIFKTQHSKRAIRERYISFLSKCNEDWTEMEDKLIMECYCTLGTRWSIISKFLRNRSGEQVKTRFKQLMKKASQVSQSKAPNTKTIEEDIWKQLNKEYNEVTMENHNWLTFL